MSKIADGIYCCNAYRVAGGRAKRRADHCDSDRIGRERMARRRGSDGLFLLPGCFVEQGKVRERSGKKEDIESRPGTYNKESERA